MIISVLHRILGATPCVGGFCRDWCNNFLKDIPLVISNVYRRMLLTKPNTTFG